VEITQLSEIGFCFFQWLFLAMLICMMA